MQMRYQLRHSPISLGLPASRAGQRREHYPTGPADAKSGSDSGRDRLGRPEVVTRETDGAGVVLRARSSGSCRRRGTPPDAESGRPSRCSVATRIAAPCGDRDAGAAGPDRSRPARAAPPRGARRRRRRDSAPAATERSPARKRANSSGATRGVLVVGEALALAEEELPQARVVDRLQAGLLRDVRRGLAGAGEVGGPQHLRAVRRDRGSDRGGLDGDRCRRARRRPDPAPGPRGSTRCGRGAAGSVAAALIAGSALGEGRRGRPAAR